MRIAADTRLRNLAVAWQAVASTRLRPRLRRGKQTTRITVSSFLASCVESIIGMRLDLVTLKRCLPFIIFILVLLVAAVAVHIDWTWKRKLAPRGGRYLSIASS